MARLMRCLYCGLLQDEPSGVKQCSRCGGELAFEVQVPPGEVSSYLQVQMELDQVSAPAGRNVDRYLLVTLRAPAEVPKEQAAPTRSGRPPMSFTAVLDVSGSMQGEKIHQAKEAVKQTLNHLHDGDWLSLITFSSEARCALEPTRVNARVREAVEQALNEIHAGGMTALCGGLELGIQKANEEKSDTNLVLLLSDGQANVGETDLEKIGLRSFQARQQGLTVSSLGLGMDYNEALMAEVATQGGGRFYHLQSSNQIVAYLTGELGEMALLAARETQIHLVVPPGSVIVPLSAAFPAAQANQQVTVTVGDLPRDLELEIPLRLVLFSQPAGNKQSIEGNVTYRSPAGNQLSARLNRVTVRFVDEKSFLPQHGVVAPVLERVVQHMRAAHVLEMSRAMARGDADQAQRATANIQSMQAYAARLGEDKGRKLAAELQNDLADMQAAPAAAKMHVQAAFSAMRRSRKFDKDKD